MNRILVTIDGTAASGKGRIAKYISNRWKLKHLDSGILYRKLAYKLVKNKIIVRSEYEVQKYINKLKKLSYRRSKGLRAEKISKLASKIATFRCVRNYVNKIQKEFVKKNIQFRGFVVDGRDIGSVVFKNADLKLFIEVNEKNRAKRRYKQLIDTGEKSIYPKILKDIKLRDKKDKLRKYSPLVIPKGAIIIDNNSSFRNTIKQINILMENIL